MATFKIVVSDPKTRLAGQKEVDQAASGLLGKKIGDKVAGDGAGLPGYQIEITGGSDQQGFPMRADVSGTGRKQIILAFGPGFHPERKGQRKRKSIRGNTIAADIAQVNVKVAQAGQKGLEELWGIKKKEKPAKEGEAKKGEKPAEKREDAKPAEPPEKEAEKKSSEGPKKEAARPEEKKEEPAKAEAKMGIKPVE